jgi:bifunctional N-acetylglucosamine-1-phosphate-uridyltransferase/glucosamine-1-phosphate-acetyltransferase GlmU-like protein
MPKRTIPPVEVESEAAIMLKYIAKRLDDIRFNNERNEYWLAQIANILRDNRHVKLTGAQRNALEAMCGHG